MSIGGKYARLQVAYPQLGYDSCSNSLRISTHCLNPKTHSAPEGNKSKVRREQREYELLSRRRGRALRERRQPWCTLFYGLSSMRIRLQVGGFVVE